jgi:DNA (cytosine-5)-methyltransferase 1
MGPSTSRSLWLSDCDAPRPLTYGSLFAGIGGFDLGLCRAGLVPAWQVEISSYCRGILDRHWPEVARHDDVRTFPPRPFSEWHVDLIAGGFPCSDVSKAGDATRPAAGLDGARSGLWTEFARVVRVLRPRYVVVENVPELLSRGLDRLLGDLAELGYDAEWGSVPAYFFGAPHRRFRLIIIAYPAGLFRAPILGVQPIGDLSSYWRCGWPAYAARLRDMADGLSADLVRFGPCEDLSALGNAILPQLAEWIGRCIIAAEQSNRSSCSALASS